MLFLRRMERRDAARTNLAHRSQNVWDMETVINLRWIQPRKSETYNPPETVFFKKLIS